jgi:hypothetical protein
LEDILSQYKVRKNETVRFEGDGTTVKYFRIATITSQAAVAIKLGKGGTVDADRKTYPAGSKEPRRAWDNA